VLKGKNAIITGTNRGIGKAILTAFAQNGANVWAHARKQYDGFEEYLYGLSEEYGVWIKPVYFDVSDYEALTAGARAILSEKKSVDVLVNNAGVRHIGLLHSTPIEQIESVMRTNFLSPLLLTQKLSKRMIAQKSGSIINISSERVKHPAPGRLAYCASKSAVMSGTECLAIEYGQFGIRVNNVSPGQIETDMLEINSDKDIIPNALARFGTPDEIADAVVFLASDKASFITGATLCVGGGRS